MNDRMQTIADLSFNPSSDFELFALEAVIDDSMATYESLCMKYGRYNPSNALESMLDTILESEDCECDDVDDEDADEAIEASLRDVGHSIMNWWRTVKSKFIVFCKKVAASVGNTVRKVQATWATRHLSANDTITISAETDKAMKVGEAAIATLKTMKNPLSTVLNQLRNGEIDDIYDYIEKFINQYADTDENAINGRARTIKGSAVREEAKKVSDAIKDGNVITTMIDRAVNDLMKGAGYKGKVVSPLRKLAGHVMNDITSKIRAEFKALMGVAKAATKAKDELKNPSGLPKEKGQDINLK